MDGMGSLFIQAPACFLHSSFHGVGVVIADDSQKNTIGFQAWHGYRVCGIYTLRAIQHNRLGSDKIYRSDCRQRRFWKQSESAFEQFWRIPEKTG
jgi:hypothetical protein